MPWNRRLICIAFVGAFQWATLHAAHAQGWPRLQGEPSEVCQDALSLGRQAFRSLDPSLPEPGTLPPTRVHSHRLLGINTRDASAEASLAGDETAFETISAKSSGAQRHLYWERQAPRGRIVIDEFAFGSQGKQYVLYVLPQEVPQAAFLQEWDRRQGPTAWKPMVMGGWRPFTVMRSASGVDWWIHPGEPNELLAPWRVFTLDGNGAHEACQIVFRPAGKTDIGLLPPPVRHLERLLKRSTGLDSDEGNYRPIAQLRLAARQTWTNVALRPWALGAPYNTRDETDAGLAAWAASLPANQRLLAEITAEVPVARTALARYYERTYSRTEADAARSAAFAIDAAIRSHYAFHRKAPGALPRDTDESPNPWGPPGDR